LDQNLRQDLAENGVRLVSEQYNWSANLDRFLDLVQLTVSGPPVLARSAISI
jgi:hypothetical protein